MRPNPPAEQCRARPRIGRLARWAAVGATGVSLGVASVTVGGSPASAEIAGDRQSAAVVLAAAAALTEFDEFALDRMGATAAYDQSAAYRLGNQYRDFARARDKAAAATAAEFGLPARTVRRAWRATDTGHQVAVLAALSQLGVAYQTNTSEPGVGFDCSGLTTYAWGRAGTQLTRQSSAQIAAAAPRDAATAQAGDLVQYPGHVMMYLGVGNAIVHASNHETDVELSQLRDGRSFNWGDPTA